MASRLLQIVLIASEPKANPDNIDSAMRASLCRSRTLALDRPDSTRHIRYVSIAGRPPRPERGCFPCILHCPSEGVRRWNWGSKGFRRVFRNHPVGARIQVRKESNESRSQDVAARTLGESAKRSQTAASDTPERSLFFARSDWCNSSKPFNMVGLTAPPGRRWLARQA